MCLLSNMITTGHMWQFTFKLFKIKYNFKIQILVMPATFQTLCSNMRLVAISSDRTGMECSISAEKFYWITQPKVISAFSRENLLLLLALEILEILVRPDPFEFEVNLTWTSVLTKASMLLPYFSVLTFWDHSW